MNAPCILNFSQGYLTSIGQVVKLKETLKNSHRKGGSRKG
jgi:hypothetical protein